MSDVVVYDVPVPLEWKLYMQVRLEDPSLGPGELAKRVGVSQQTIYHWRRKPSFQRYETWCLEKRFESLPPELRETIVQVRERIESYSGDMLDRLLGILDTTEDDKLAVQVAQDLLDRSGIVPVRKVEVQRTPMLLTPELAEMLNRRALEAKQAPPIAIEGEVVS